MTDVAIAPAADQGAAVASPAPASSSSSSSSPAAPLPSAPSPLLHSFSIPWMESYVHAQIWFLNSSLFIWVGDESASMQSLTLAIRSDMDVAPSVSCLLGPNYAVGGGPSSDGGVAADSSAGEEDQAGIGMSTRIASVFKLPVFVSLNLSAASIDSGVPGMSGAGPEMHTFVERAIIKELRTCKQVGMMEEKA